MRGNFFRRKNIILNDFLQIKLGVEFEDKYNALAVEEILANKEKYPLIASTVADIVQNEADMEKEWDYESGFFDCYEIRIGKNLLRFFSTERGFDSLSVLRFPSRARHKGLALLRYQ